ncbi:MAG: hypothetical protein ABSA79_10050 [Candidatus Bathyarchaeia archaeon]|jgi:hypothetical protein
MNKKIPIVIAIIALFAVSGISLAGAKPSMVSPSTMAPNMSSALAMRSYIRINGNITQWGTTAVNGALQTQAGASTRVDLSTNQIATATAIWTTNISRPIVDVEAKQNFTYVFYEARLTNASVSTLSTTTVGTNYFLNGTWNVYTVVSNVTIITNDQGQITNVHRSTDTSIQKAYGELTVTDNWTKFTLAIKGIDPLTGSVSRSVQRQTQFNQFKVTDDTTTNAVTKADVAEVIRSYGSMPGWGNYDAKMDFCGHYKIDIADLSTVASNM